MDRKDIYNLVIAKKLSGGGGGGGDIPQDLKDDMNSVFNKKFSTSTDYSPEVWADTVNLMGVLPTDTAQGAVANFPDGADDVPVDSLVVNIEPVQAGTGDPSPSNPRAISGWSAVTISHSGADTSEAEEVEIALGQTVYGGELDVTNGVLRVTHKSIVLDGSENWGNLTQNHFALLTLEDNYTRNTSTNLCDKFKIQNITGWTNIENLSVAFLVSSSSSLNVIALRNDVWQTTQDLKDWLSSNNTRLVYELETPVEITLTPEQINTLKGVNNIWADTGDTSVEYRADVQLYIDKKIAEAVGGNRSLSLSKSAPEEVKEETKEEELLDKSENVDTDNR